MSYWSQMYRRPTRAERLEVQNGKARFESLMAKKLSEKDRSFAESSQASVRRWRQVEPQTD